MEKNKKAINDTGVNESGKEKEKTEKNIEGVELEEKLNELEILRQSLEERKNDSDKYYDQLLHLKAEYENYRKRVEKESVELVKYGKSEIIEKVFPVLDSFEKAFPAIEKSRDLKSVLDGIKLIYKHFTGILEKEGLKRIESEGKKFDPYFHHAVMTRAGEDEDRIIEEVQAGYMLGERVIRPAMVVVVKKDEGKKPEEDKGDKKK